MPYLLPSAEKPIPVVDADRFRFDCTWCGACCFARVQLYPLDVRRLLEDPEARRVHGCTDLEDLVAAGWVRFVGDYRTGVPVAFLGQDGNDPRLPCRFLELQQEGDGSPLLHPETATSVYHCRLHESGAKPSICRAMPVERYLTAEGKSLALHLRLPASDCPALERGPGFTVGEWIERNTLPDDYGHANEFLVLVSYLAGEDPSPVCWPDKYFQVLLRLWYDPARGTWIEAIGRTPQLALWAIKKIQEGSS